MDTNNEYRAMCMNSPEIQSKWNPSEGDFMLTKSSYCDGQNNNGCTDNKPCLHCLEMGNVYVISGKYDYDELVGGTHWFFGGSACVKGDGCRCNDTHCSIMSESGYSTIVPSPFKCSKEDMVWLPRQDQIQSMFLNGYTEISKVRKFTWWIDTEAEYNGFKDSLEMLWLMFYMRTIHNKQWNKMVNVKKWEDININE